MEEEEEEEIIKEEEKEELEPVVHHEEEVEELADEEEGHQGIVPISGEKKSFEDDFQIYNETEFVISNGNSTDEVVGNLYQFNHCAV